MLTPDFAFIHQITVEPWLKHGINGPEYSPAQAYRARVEFGQKRVSLQGAAGGAVNETVAAGYIFLPRGTRFPVNSRITFDGRTFTALTVEPQYAFSETHVEVTIQ